MEASVKAFWLPKRGNTAEEYEDASAHSTYRFAVADGATESSFAERWAQALVKSFINTPLDHIRNDKIPLEEWLSPLQKEWHKSIPWDRLPWYAEEKARTGAFSAFLGVEITPAPSRFRIVDLFKRRKGTMWHAIAVGDCEFFHISDDSLAKAFPFEKSDQFNSRPMLLSSNPARNNPVWKNIQQAEGDLKTGDIFLLTTDAIGAWFLKEHEAGNKPWKKLLELKTENDFNEFVHQLRIKNSVRNDDSTLLVCEWKERI